MSLLHELQSVRSAQVARRPDTGQIEQDTFIDSGCLSRPGYEVEGIGSDELSLDE
jgi:hypothetical protein